MRTPSKSSRLDHLAQYSGPFFALSIVLPLLIISLLRAQLLPFIASAALLVVSLILVRGKRVSPWISLLCPIVYLHNCFFYGSSPTAMVAFIPSFALAFTISGNHRNYMLASVIGFFLIIFAYSGQEQAFKLEAYIYFIQATLTMLYLLFINYRRNIESLKDMVAIKNLLRTSCHDISNSLTVILGSSQMAESGLFDENPELAKKAWEKAGNASESINWVLHSIRAYENLLHPKSIRHDQEIPIDEYFTSIISSFRDSAKHKGITISFHKETLKQEHFHGPANTLRLSCFSFLIQRGIHLAERGSQLMVKVNHDGDRLHFSVESLGSYIDNDTINNLLCFDFVKRPSQLVGEKSGDFCFAVCHYVISQYGGKLAIKCSDLDGKHKVISHISLP